MIISIFRVKCWRKNSTRSNCLMNTFDMGNKLVISFWMSGDISDWYKLTESTRFDFRQFYSEEVSHQNSGRRVLFSFNWIPQHIECSTAIYDIKTVNRSQTTTLEGGRFLVNYHQMIDDFCPFSTDTRVFRL